MCQLPIQAISLDESPIYNQLVIIQMRDNNNIKDGGFAGSNEDLDEYKLFSRLHLYNKIKERYFVKSYQ